MTGNGHPGRTDGIRLPSIASAAPAYGQRLARLNYEIRPTRVVGVFPNEASCNRNVSALLRSFLARKQLLLLLDNFEHVLPAAVSLPELLVLAPRLKILVTSRAALQLVSEREFPVPTLALPDDVTSAPLDQLLAAPAVALFVQRAQAVRPDFQATAETAPIIAEICRQLG